jgi:ABC-2 type transport system ATP-binding protein
MAVSPVIEADQLTRVYPGRVAVDRLTFSVGRGEIVGFLGPNGAGKSTTMRMLAGYLPPTSGAVRIAGLDPDREPHQVRRKVGYMPENNPLHLDMRVVNYLCFRGRIKGLGWRASPVQAEAVIRRCGLGEVRTRIIGHLSKGYRQRVGIADAILHDPELILLDEPTIGLDPHQIRAVRDLIRQLGQQHTVLISTHILSEVEMMCSRVLILHQGRLIASDTPAALERTLGWSGTVTAEIAATPEAITARFDGSPGVKSVCVEPLEGGYCQVTLVPEGEEDLRPSVYEAAREMNWPLRELTRERQSLEEMFVRLTQAPQLPNATAK